MTLTMPPAMPHKRGDLRRIGPAPAAPVAPLPARVPDRPDIARPTRRGLAGLIIGIGGFTLWAALAPLSSAAVAPGNVGFDTKRKTVQHLEGGIVSRILVHEGDRVRAGQPLVSLDTTQAEATWALHRGQLLAARALEARLIAERDGADAIVFPPILAGTRSDPAMLEKMEGQKKIFATRRESLDGQRSVLQERIGQLHSQIVGLDGQSAAARRQIQLIDEEIADVSDLVKKGLERRPRLRALERQAAALSGDLAEYQGDIARAAQSIGETRLQILNLDKQRAEQVAGELRDVQNRIADLQERVRAAEDILQRRDIVAPVDGSVINLVTVTPGGVVAAGAKLLELVPEDDSLVIEAQIRTTDIDTVRPGQPAEVHLVAYKQRTTPILQAHLTYVSGDSVVDERTGVPYFRARVEVAPDELERMKDYSLLPGMPVQVMVLTGERTFLDYLIEPLHDSFTRAFRED